MDIVSKITGDSLTANEFNQIPSELEGLITDTGQTPAAGDLAQIRQAVARMSGSGDFYTDSGSANAYSLATIGSQPRPAAYTDGMRVRFVPGNNNTGASTVNVAGIGIKNIKTGSGAGTDPAADAIVSGEIIELFYDLTNDVFKIALFGTSGGGSVTDGAKARVNFNGTGVVAIREGNNVSSITDNATGRWSVNYTNNMANTDYTIHVTAGDEASAQGQTWGALDVSSSKTYASAVTTSRVDVQTYADNFGKTDCTYVGVTVYGELA